MFIPGLNIRVERWSADSETEGYRVSLKDVKVKDAEKHKDGK